MTTRGVVYIATGKEYIGEALDSAASVKNRMPGLPVTLFCDQDVTCSAVNEVIRIAADSAFPSCASKIPHIARSPYDQTLFLDSDTYVCGDLAELFVVLDAFDIAAAHSPSRAIYEVDGVPDAFPEFNTGVILFGGSPAIRAFFASWAETFTRYLERLASGEVRWLRPADKRVHVLNDQGTFREALYRSRLRVATLPPEYNCRFSAPGFVDGPVRILHGRGLDLPRVAAAINAIRTRRGYHERSGKLELVRYAEPSSSTYSLENIRYTVRRRGLRWTLGVAVRQLRAATRRGV